MPLSRDTVDGRRADEVDKQIRVLERRKLAPALKQLQDGQVVIVKGTGELYWREGKHIYKSTGTLVS